MKKFFQDFKEFALKGNIIDMAIGVIIGGAFGKIVSSLVNDILMPCISMAIGGKGFTDLKYVITEAQPATAEGLEAVEEVAINYGMFIQNIIDFFIIAISIFIALRVTLKLVNKKKEEEAAAPAPEPSDEVKLLSEIRDILKKEEK